MAIRKDFAAATRPRNALATRAAILEAARACFTEAGYEHVGVRDVAARAGVNGALVIRYFGSKVQLFAQALAGRFLLDHLSDGRPLDGERIAQAVLKKEVYAARFDAVLALVRSAPDPQAAAILKSGLEEEFIKPLASSLRGAHARQRAALITAYLLGLGIARDVMGITTLADSPDKALVALVAPVIQSYMDGDGGRARKTPKAGVKRAAGRKRRSLLTGSRFPAPDGRAST
jgi:AcrR family transcriptional regulator